MSLSKEFAQMVQEQKDSISFIHPLLSGAEFSLLSLQENRCLLEYQFLLKMAGSKKWQQTPDFLEALHDPGTAIIVTDKSETIEWVSSGFHKMTGYLPNEAIGRTPKFLQGEDTNPQELSNIRKSLEEQKTFAGTLLNYRKNGESYLCHVKIFPLFNNRSELVNFMAIENEVPENTEFLSTP